MCRWHAEVPSPGDAVFSDFAAQAKLVRFESVEGSALLDDAIGTQQRCGDYTAIYLLSTAQSWHTDQSVLYRLVENKTD